MICPKCKEQGKKSCVYGGTSFVTCAYYQPYYDEEGVYHSHDGNRHTTSYTCSNGHKITISGTGKCPSCTWGHNNETITVEDTPSNPLNISGSNLVQFKND